MRKKILLLLLAVLCLVLIVAGCGGGGGKTSGEETPATEDEGKTYVIRAPLMLDTSHPHYISAETVMKPMIEEGTNGKVKVEVYPNGQLGSDRQTTEACQMGTLEMTLPGLSVIPNFDDSFMILDVPYVFTSVEGCRNALDGKLGQMLSDSLAEKAGMIVLGYGESGFRQLSNNVRPVKSPADMKGMKIRVQENPYQIAIFEALGANPTPMAFGELYTALQQKQVDGQDNSIMITYTSKFYEVQKYYTLIQHTFNANAFIINKEFFESLPAEYQTVIKDAVKAAVVELRRIVDEREQQYLDEMKAAGLEVNELTREEKQAFIDATQSVRDKFVAEFGERGQQMLDVAAEYQN
ncbi:MAG: TRAP transporter substrate-binding protein [Clostridia bacterium]|nr:TRAP transporter substrate-binding protein [Clostridia bacterium]